VPEDFTGTLLAVREEAESSFPWSIMVVITDTMLLLNEGLPTATPPSISIPLDPLGDGGGTFTLSAPSLSSEALANASAPCSWSGTGTAHCGTYGDFDDEGGFYDLWGFRGVIRGTFEIGLYLGFAWWAWNKVRNIDEPHGDGGDPSASGNYFAEFGF